jgi:hypothetical protein
MASERQKQELSEKVSALVRTKFGGDYSIAFRHYGNGDENVGKGRVRVLLKDAGIGSIWTRWARVAGIMKELDTNGDGGISWPEFAAAFERQEGLAPKFGAETVDRSGH